MECDSDVNFPLLCWYFEKLNLQPSTDAEEFLDHLTNIYGEAVVNKLLSILEKRLNEDTKENEDELYSFKNQTLSFSLDFARYSANLYNQFLTWFLTQKFSPPGRLLDLGCDNGITACFFGLLFPDSEVIGVDISKNAISSAKELARLLDIKNVQFINTDFTDSNQSQKLGGFDMIVSLRSLQDIYGYFPKELFWSFDSQPISVPYQFTRISAIFDSLQNVDSTLIACERITGLDQCVFFMEALQKSRIYTDYSQSDLISFHELGEMQEMPIFIARKQANGQSVREGITELYKRGQSIMLEPGYEYEGPVAQLVFAEFAHKEFLDRIQVTDGNGSDLHYELWQSSKLLLRYQYSNSGHRELHILPIDSLSIAKQGLRIIAAMNG